MPQMEQVEHSLAAGSEPLGRNNRLPAGEALFNSKPSWQ